MNSQDLKQFLKTNGYIDVDHNNICIPYIFSPIDKVLYRFDRRIITIETSFLRPPSFIKYPFIQFSLDLYNFAPAYSLINVPPNPFEILASIQYTASMEDSPTLPTPFVYIHSITEFYTYAQQQILNSPTPTEYLFHTDLFLRKVAKETLQ